MSRNIYEVTVEGQYYTLADGRKGIRPYTFTFRADDKIKAQGFLSMFRTSLIQRGSEESVLLKQMKQKYPDYKRFRTHQITQVINITKNNTQVRELSLMNRAQVVKYIETRGLPIDVGLYPDVTELRQAMRDYNENPQVFEQRQQKRRELHGETLDAKMALAELNTNIQEPDRPEPPVVNEPPPLPKDGIVDFEQQREMDALLNGV